MKGGESMSTKVAKRILEILYCIGFMAGTFFVTDFILDIAWGINSGTVWLTSIISATIVVGILSVLTAPGAINGLSKFAYKVINRVSRMPARELLGGTIGLILGLLIATLIGSSVSTWKYGSIVVLVFSLFMGYIGLMVGIKKNEELISLFTRKTVSKEKPTKGDFKISCQPKLLDTSVIIDGRIADIYQTGFIDGPLVMPGFILNELKHVADSSDPLKKNRGRRGLDIINKLRKDFEDQIIMVEKDYEDVKEVDVKLIRLAMEMNGAILTNDFNLNKMAQVQNVLVLNINELSNAVKTVVLPGEELVVRILKEGKEAEQGIAYLEDGTMIVVEGGWEFEGVTLTVVVTSVLQTSAGRMIFAKPK